MTRRLRTHRAGWVGDAEYGVVTLASDRREGDHPHCRLPCAQCPWRADLPTGRFPPEAFRHSATTAYDMAPNVFACHMAGETRPRTCAGFLLRGADHNLSIRMAYIEERIRPGSVSDGGAPLYSSYRAMAIANGVDPDDPALGPCR